MTRGAARTDFTSFRTRLAAWLRTRGYVQRPHPPGFADTTVDTYHERGAAGRIAAWGETDIEALHGAPGAQLFFASGRWARVTGPVIALARWTRSDTGRWTAVRDAFLNRLTAARMYAPQVAFFVYVEGDETADDPVLKLPARTIDIAQGMRRRFGVRRDMTLIPHVCTPADGAVRSPMPTGVFGSELEVQLFAAHCGWMVMPWFEPAANRNTVVVRLRTPVAALPDEFLWATACAPGPFRPVFRGVRAVRPLDSPTALMGFRHLMGLEGFGRFELVCETTKMRTVLNGFGEVEIIDPQPSVLARFAEGPWPETRNLYLRSFDVPGRDPSAVPLRDGWIVSPPFADFAAALGLPQPVLPPGVTA